MIFNIFLFYNIQIVQWAFLWMDQCIQWETYLKMGWDDDECVEKKRKMKIFYFVIIHNSKGVYLFLTLKFYSILIFHPLCLICRCNNEFVKLISIWVAIYLIYIQVDFKETFLVFIAYLIYMSLVIQKNNIRELVVIKLKGLK
jgi:hypothetical protein